MVDEDFEFHNITEGAVICLGLRQITYWAEYYECDVEGNTIKTVELVHNVGGKRRTKRTERQVPYLLYGDTLLMDLNVSFRDAIVGNNTITAKANCGTTMVINFNITGALRSYEIKNLALGDDTRVKG